MEKLINSTLIVVEKYPSTKTVALSLVLMAIFYIVNRIIEANIDKKKDSKSEKTLLKKKIKPIFRSLLLICLIFIWFTQLQVFMVSLLAVAAAIVVALKELIMCVTGGLMIKMSNIFKNGHRIEIDGTRGFVIEKNLLSTKILEIGPEKHSQQTTGDIISIPNSLMLSKSLKNESYFKGYSIKSFIFKIDNLLKIDQFEQLILQKAMELASDYIEDAKKGISVFCEKEGILIPSLMPKTKIILEDSKDFSVLVKLPIQNKHIADIEQELNRFYLNWRKEQ